MKTVSFCKLHTTHETKAVITPVASFFSRTKTGEISREWSVHSFLAFKMGSMYDGLTLRCKVYWFGEFMGDIHYEAMARI